MVKTRKEMRAIMTCKIYLYKGKEINTENGHPWIYDNEIEGYDGTFENGDIVEVFNCKGIFIGKGYANRNSKIAVRIMTRNADEAIDKNFFRNALKNAWEYRKKVIDTSSCRFVFGEADFLPGLIIDKYEDYYVIQSLSLGIDRYKDIIVELLKDEYGAKGIYERSDVKVRELEGMQQTKGFLTAPFDTNVQITENGVKYYVDIAEGQKTGFFLDQKENRAAIHKICKDAEVLDCFTHTGSFALNAGIAGAKKVLGIDISELAVNDAKKNAELNGLSNKVTFECHDAFNVLHDWSTEGRKFDVVILDPPAFTKSRGTIKSAARGYKEINLRALKMVRSGGFLVTCSCSHFMSPELFKKAISDAAKDAHKILRQVEFRTQAADHPILQNFEESYYLKFYIFQVI